MYRYLYFWRWVKNRCMYGKEKNEIILPFLFLFLFPFWFFILCFLSLKKNIKFSYHIYQKTKLSKTKKLPSLFYRSWRIGKDRIHFILQYKENPLFFYLVSHFLSYLCYLFTLAYATCKGPPKWHARYKVHGAELFGFIYCFCSNEMDMISPKLGNIDIDQVFF